MRKEINHLRYRNQYLESLVAGFQGPVSEYATDRPIVSTGGNNSNRALSNRNELKNASLHKRGGGTIKDSSGALNSSRGGWRI
jgi:hypothetical protein